MMNDLATHIAALNAKTEAWVAEDPKNRWAGLLTDDVAHWAEIGITTADQLDHYLLVSDVYEATRSVYGYKPHWGNLNRMTNAQLVTELKHLEDSAKADREYHQKQEAEHAKAVQQAMDHKSGFALGDIIGTSLLTGKTVILNDPKGLLEPETTRELAEAEQYPI